MKKRTVTFLAAVSVGAMIFSGCASEESASTKDADTAASEDVEDTEDADTEVKEEQESSADEEKETENAAQTVVEQITINQSPDKYTWYVQNYVGRNLASVGYTSLGGERMDSYGSGNIQLVLVSDDGSFIDIEDDEALKQYMVAAQNFAPNTEIKYTFETDSEGNEYDNLTSWKNIEEIFLLVKKVNADLAVNAPTLTQGQPAPDRYTNYIRDYVGCNADMVGYLSLGGNRMDAYGPAYVQLNMVTNDGSYVDPEDDEFLKQYKVVSQDVAPGTQITYTYMLDSDGNEYDNLVEAQSLENITLYLEKF